MSNPAAESRKWPEWPSVSALAGGQTESMFRLLFERSADAIWLFDPQAGVFVDCNQAAVELLRAGTKESLMCKRPSELSPMMQADGQTSEQKTHEVITLATQNGGHRCEWLGRRFDGEEVPLEVLITPITANDQTLFVVVSRDITERKKAEAALLESQQLLASV